MGKQRMVLRKAFPEGYRAVAGLERANHDGPIEAPLYELIKIRASEINRCGFCLDMHSRDARFAISTLQQPDPAE